eukprot:TRINITY_DN9822_c0_g1_i1.p1 TRINITY_DN9822_c0_g1~~TRINITY_DN9822_c0_g1_i1.p1  ORF type:complete len:638 (+),score=138.61 TRINITY_DN9822_c0_g1_i1:57-1970(+)
MSEAAQSQVQTPNSEERAEKRGRFDTFSEEGEASSNSVVVDVASLSDLHSSIESLKAQNLRNQQILEKLLKANTGQTSVVTGPSSSQSTSQSYSRQRHIQHPSVIQHWEQKKACWRDATSEALEAQNSGNEYFNTICDLYENDSHSIRNLHDSYCATLSCAKTVDPFLNPDYDLSAQVMASVVQLTQAADDQITAIRSIEEKYILNPDDLLRLDPLKCRIQARRDMLEVYQIDWRLFNNFVSPTDSAVPFSFRILEQPMSYVLPPHDRSKKPTLEGPFRLQFFAGPSQIYEVEGNCVSTVVYYEERGKTEFVCMDQVAASEPLMQAPDLPTYTATFPKFEIDLSGKKQFYIMFYLTIKHFKNLDDPNPEVIKMCLQSNVYSNIIHQDQWYLEAGRLLLRSAFDTSKDAVPWPYFCNYLQLHFLKESRQNLSVREGRRPLNLQDLNYLKRFQKDRKNEMALSVFWGASRNQPAASHSFWHWFGSILASLRFKKSVIHMWSKGYILGFCKKDEAESLLRTRDGLYANPGTFLVRFSETNPGLFACVFVASPDSKLMKDERERRQGPMNLCKHIVIEDSELNQNTSLADYLVANNNLEFLLHLDPSGNIYTSNAEDILQGYLVKRKQPTVQGEVYMNLRR